MPFNPFQKRDAELDEEVQAHFRAAVADYVAQGQSPKQARESARLQFGNVGIARELTREAWGWRWLEDFLHDCRFALRGMGRSPAFTAAAVLTIAIGVGANTGVWSIVEALVRRSLPISRPEQLHAIRLAGSDDEFIVSHPLMQRMQAETAGAAEIAGMGSISSLYATLDDHPESIVAQVVTGNFFTLLGLRAQAGRVLEPEDDRIPGGSPVVVITESFWERCFGRDPSAVGRTIRINGFPVVIVGVIQSGFGGLWVGTVVDVFAPVAMQHDLRYGGNAATSNADPGKPWMLQNGISWLELVTRTEEQTRDRLTQLIERPFRANQAIVLADRDSTSRARGMNQRIELAAIPRGFSGLRADFRDPLRMLLGGVTLVLLVTCANLAGLVLARGEARSHEMAIRSAMGARSGRLVRQVSAEILTLVLIGGALGLVVAQLVIKTLLLLASSGPRAVPLDATLGGPVLLFAFGVTALSAVLIGLAPALRMRRFDLYADFKLGSRATTRGQRGTLGRLLVGAQVAIALVLVTSAGVLISTFRNYQNLPVGFDRDAVVGARIDIRALRYPRDQLPGLYSRLLDAARTVHGVQSASLSAYGLGFGGRSLSGFGVPDRVIVPGTNSGQENYVSAGYFRTVGIPIQRGRDFTPADATGRPRVAVVTEAFAKHFFGRTDVIGTRFGHSNGSSITSTNLIEVVGVARDLRVNGLKEEPPRMVYYPLAQYPGMLIQSLDIRVSGQPGSVLAALRTAIERVDRNLPIREVVTLRSYIERGLSRERLVARLAASFGLLALLLAGIGLYGVISYSVARRTNEMGLRLALGASPVSVSWLVMRGSLGLVAAGLAAGVALWFPLLGLTRALAYGVSPHDPRLLGLGFSILLLVGSIAAMIPAVRASRVDPIDAIRAD